MVIHIAKHGGAGVIAFVHALGPAQAAAQKLCAFVNSGLYVALYGLPLAFTGQGANAFAFVRTVDDLYFGSGFCSVLQSFGIDTALHQKARRCVTALTGIAHAFVDAKAHGFVHFAIGKNEVGRFATQFLHHALDGVGGMLGDRDARSRRAGEGNKVHLGVAAQHGADVWAIAVQHIEHARRVAGLVHKLRH